MLVLGLMVKSRLKYSLVFLKNACNILTKSQRTVCTSGDKDDQIITSAKLLDIKYKFFAFIGDLKETIN